MPKCPCCHECFEIRVIEGITYWYCLLCAKYFVVDGTTYRDVTDNIKTIKELQKKDHEHL